MQKDRERRWPRREAWNRFCPRAFRGSVALPVPWFWVFSLQSCDTVHFCRCSLPARSTLLRPPQHTSRALVFEKEWSGQSLSSRNEMHTHTEDGGDGESKEERGERQMLHNGVPSRNVKVPGKANHRLLMLCQVWIGHAKAWVLISLGSNAKEFRGFRQNSFLSLVQSLYCKRRG